jgi:alpha-methylacyl-CoA racemase
MGGGGLILAFGLLAALLNRERGGCGQIVDAAMIDGSAVLAASFYTWAQTGQWSPTRGTNMIDSGAPYYDTYQTADGRWLAVAAVEPKFYRAFLDLLEVDPATLPEQDDRAAWPATKRRFADLVRGRTLTDWCARAEGSEACVSPVLDIDEVESDPHLSARGTLVRHHGLLQPAPAPRFSATPARLGQGPAAPGEHTEEALVDWGIDREFVADLARHGVVAGPDEGPFTGDSRTSRQHEREERT